jgi:hypothetical protein
MSALDSSVTLDEVFSVVAGKRVPLAPELAGYLVLEIAEHADPNGGDVDPRSVYVGEEGTVALVKPKREAASGDAETSIRAALARLLDASGSQTPALSAASKRKPGTGLPALAEELEAALIPVNRATGRRALARLAREVKRVTLGVGRNALPSSSDAAPGSRRPSSPSQQVQAPPEPLPGAAPARSGPSPSFSREEEPTTARGQIPEEILKKATPEPLLRARAHEAAAAHAKDSTEMPTTQFEPVNRTPSPSQADVDDLIAQFGVSGTGDQHHARELKAMVGLDATPPPPPEIVRRLETREVSLPESRKQRDSGVDSLLALGGEAPSRKARPAQPPAGGARSPGAVAQAKDVDERQLPTQPSSVRKRHGSASSGMFPDRRRRGSWIVLALGLVVVAAGAYAVFQLRPGSAARGPAASTSATSSPPAPIPTACKATLIITDVPPHAEVLLGKGQAPAEVELMPVGARLEFVATAEGFAPKRVVVPAGARWDNGADGKPHFEVAVQLDKAKARPGTNDPWPAGEPGSEVGGQGPPGTVRVVATPRGAEVWMLAGIGPDARVEQLPCGKDVEVLMAGPTTYRKRLHVAASDFVLEETPGVPAPKVPTRVARLSGK